jgi:diguanylate cyclase (GGDEF)-like protein/PAS domain S-box-containing protein
VGSGIDTAIAKWMHERQDSFLSTEVADSEKLYLEGALRRSEEQFQALFDTNPVAMYIYDRHTLGILAVNDAAIRQYGLQKEEFLTKTLMDLRPEEDIPALLRDIAKNGVKFQPHRGMWKHRTKDGSILDVEISCTPLVFRGIEADLITAVDDTERRRATEKLQESEKKYRVLFEDAADATWLTDDKGIADCNSAALEMFGYASVALMPHPVHMSPPVQPDGAPSDVAGQKNIAEAFRKGKARFEWQHKRSNGELFPADVCLTRVTLNGKQRLLATVRDITERRRAEEALLLKTALLEAETETTMDGILAVDESDRVILVNKHFQLSFGIPDELLNRRDDLMLQAWVLDKLIDPEAFVARIKYLNGHKEEKSTDELRLKDGTIFERYSAPLVDSLGRYRGRIWYHRNITDRKTAEQRIQFLAYYDALTELPQRALLKDRLDIALASARRRGEKVAVLFIDLDEFKGINDLFGHPIGDGVLKEVAKRLLACGREQDTVARVGGDEFVMLLADVRDAVAAASAAERVFEALHAGIVLEGKSINLGCSIGVSMFPEHGVDGETLIKNADVAMYRAKKAGRGNVRFFTEQMNAEAIERRTMDLSLSRALKEKEFFLVYQPQIEIETGRIIGLEALIRWNHPEMGLVPPNRFISIAEDNGLILPIGEWVLKTACAQARKWQDAGLEPVPVAVNVSAVQFRQEDFPALVDRTLRETGLSAQYLELELTESLLLSNEETMFQTLRGLKSMGVLLAIDDFGTGYSSLSYLKLLPVGKLKIDRSFIQDIATDPDDRAITNAIVSMAKSLNLKVIAEGVETEAQLSILRENQCDEIQGFYFSKPVSADEAAAMQRDRIRPKYLEVSAPFAALALSL